jgi:tetratricopeptide (TPR) repeat protein
MYEEANAEIEEINPRCRHTPEVLQFRVVIYCQLRKWHLMEIVARKLVEWNPEAPGHFVDLAYATRRAQSLQAAYPILTRAAELHPDDALIRFNLACYEAQLGDLVAAKAHLTCATVLDSKIQPTRY